MSDSLLQQAVGNADWFPVLRHWRFLNHAGVCPLPRCVGDAMRRFIAEAENGSYLDTQWHADLESLRTEAAGLINAHRDEIAFIKNTSEGLATVARGLAWNPGDRIVTTGVEYPANIYPWMDACRHGGAELQMVAEETDADGRRRVPLDKILDAAGKPGTRLVSLSHVEFASGQRHDLATLGAFCRKRGILLSVDGIQSLGVLPVDVQAMNIDFLSADGHKWLLGTEGAGIFYCRRELLPQLRPLVIGWLNVVDALDFGHYDYTLKPDAGRFEGGSHNIAGLLGLRAAIQMLRAVGIDAVAGRVKQLGDRLVAGLAAKGYRVLSPRDGDAWSGIVSFIAPGHEADHAAIFQSLRKEHKTEIALREGRLRVSPHFYNTDWQIDDLLAALPPM